MKVQLAVTLCLAVSGMTGWLVALAAPQAAQPVVRIAQLKIHAAQLNAYTAAVKEEMEAAVRLEPGVLAIYAVADKSDPTQLFFLEMYASERAYLEHRESAHFKKYVAVTQPMIQDRKLIETVPVQLSEKPKR